MGTIGGSLPANIFVKPGTVQQGSIRSIENDSGLMPTGFCERQGGAI